MDIELMKAAAPIAAALIARIPASQPNNGLSNAEIKSAFLQAMEALSEARQDEQEGRWTLPEFR